MSSLDPVLTVIALPFVEG
jgi:hypothetical protein